MALYNLRNPAVKRLMKEAEELREPTEEYYAQPLDDNLFEWHFTLRGPPGTEFEDGIYHGRITLPPEYPMKPPTIILLTPNGRFDVNTKICLSISGHHPETWQPSWSIRTALLAIIGFLPTHGNGALGSLDYSPEERIMLALNSQKWKCSICGYVKDFLKKKSELPGKCTDVLEKKLQKELEVNQPVSDSLNLNFNQNKNEDVAENGSDSSNILDNQTLTPQKNNLVTISDQTTSCARNRHLTLNQKVNQTESVNLQHTEKIEGNSHANYGTAIVIWIIISILVVLAGRRVLYL